MNNQNTTSVLDLPTVGPKFRGTCIARQQQLSSDICCRRPTSAANQWRSQDLEVGAQVVWGTEVPQRNPGAEHEGKARWETSVLFTFEHHKSVVQTLARKNYAIGNEENRRRVRDICTVFVFFYFRKQ